MADVPLPVTRSGRRTWDRSLGELLDVGATPDDVREAVAAFNAKWPQADVSAAALARQWHLLDVRESAARSAGYGETAVIVGEPIDDDYEPIDPAKVAAAFEEGDDE